MGRLLLALTLTTVFASAASAAVMNGGFDDGTLNGWTKTGFGNIYFSGGTEGLPNSPSGEPFAGAITSFGPGIGSISQSVDLTGAGYLSLEALIGNRGTQPAKVVTLDVLWNNVPVKSLTATAVPGLAVGQLNWESFFVPLVGIGTNTIKIQWNHNYTERAWTLVDNVIVDVPEPATIALLGLSLLPQLRRRRS